MENYKMIVDYLINDEVIKTEITDNKDTIIEELGITLKEQKEYSIVYSKKGLYNIIVYNYVKTKHNRDVLIRRTFELDLL